MKKLFTSFLSAALVVAAAGQVSATALETSGEIRARFWYLDNYVKNKQTTEMWDQRLRLNLVWPVAEGVKVSARADIMEGLWGDNTLVANTTGSGATAVTSYAASPNTRPAVAWDHVNMQFAWPGTPLTFTIGRQDASWGPGMFVKSDNRDRFKVTSKFGDTTVLYTYDKYTEVFGLHDVASLDDRRQHSFGAISKLAGWNVGLIYGLVEDETNTNIDVQLNAIDGYAMGKVGPADIKAEVTVAFGENDLAVGTDVDLEGLMAYLGVSLPVGPVTLGLEGAYAAGDDPDTTDTNEGALRMDYQSPFWSVILFNNMDYQGFDTQNNFASDFSLTNAMAGKVSVALSPMKGLSVYGAAVYAVRDQVAAGVDDAMGTELDLVATYAITENVSWTVGGGFLMAGDFYGDIDDPWGAVSNFTVKF